MKEIVGGALMAGGLGCMTVAHRLLRQKQYLAGTVVDLAGHALTYVGWKVVNRK